MIRTDTTDSIIFETDDLTFTLDRCAPFVRKSEQWDLTEKCVENLVGEIHAAVEAGADLTEHLAYISEGSTWAFATPRQKVQS